MTTPKPRTWSSHSRSCLPSAGASIASTVLFDTFAVAIDLRPSVPIGTHLELSPGETGGTGEQS